MGVGTYLERGVIKLIFLRTLCHFSWEENGMRLLRSQRQLEVSELCYQSGVHTVLVFLHI
jgi:hypothetical protein